MAPRQLAEQVLTHLDLNGIASKVEIAGPCFINIYLDPAFPAEHVQQALASDRLGVATPENRPLWLTTLRQTWRKRCMSVTCALPLLVTQQAYWSSSVTAWISRKPRRRLGHPVRYADCMAGKAAAGKRRENGAG